ncbi:MAG TPA: aminotransferase class I/II-fold pyridoxal phosphate-dependent enzyme [Thermoanaerobaculia bacterium]|jgi:histidinol-phosphate aminotransferase|nr:aminotransferase class I/II-fold pyridoxal phosphate-dependent enzyme [Thermoanaerobaculia bacterium]
MALTSSSLSRRGFVQILGAGAAAAVVRPQWPAALAQLPATASGIVRLSSNENPYGPSTAAFDAMRKSFDLVWRYPDEEVDALTADLAKLHGVAGEQVLLGAGSSQILKIAAAAFTGPGKPLVMAEPTFEAIGRYAQAAGAEVVKVPLTADYRHDLERMLPAGAGLIYICNPNNPTASLTPKAEVRAFLDRLPAGTRVLIDEAYFHYAESGDYESVIPQIKDRPNLIVARTFSKVYGMAGLRCGYAVAQPETIRLLLAQHVWDNVNIMACTAARASLGDSAHVERSRRLNRETRAYVRSGLEGMGYKVIPSETNFLMADLRRDVGSVIDALKQRNVEPGRRFPAMPNYLRVTIGTRPQMEAFLGALRTAVA